MAKIRVNWSIEAGVYNILKELSKRSKHSISTLVETAVVKTYRDKAEVYKEKIREHAKKINYYQDQLKILEEKRRK